MQKPASLRAFLVSTVPGIVDDQDKLAVFIDKCSTICRATGSLSFEYRYTVTVALTPYVGDLDKLTVPLLAWIATNQPDLLDGAMPQPFTFDAEILDQDQTDLTIQLQLRESVNVTPRDDGGYVAEAIPEPTFSDSFDGVPVPPLYAAPPPGVVLLRQLYLNDALGAESKDPAWLAQHGV